MIVISLSMHFRVDGGEIKNQWQIELNKSSFTASSITQIISKRAAGYMSMYSVNVSFRVLRTSLFVVYCGCD